MGGGGQSGGKGILGDVLNPAGALWGTGGDDWAAAYDPIGSMFGSKTGSFLDPGGGITRQMMGEPTKEAKEENEAAWATYYKEQAEYESQRQAKYDRTMSILMGTEVPVSKTSVLETPGRTPAFKGKSDKPKTLSLLLDEEDI